MIHGGKCPKCEKTMANIKMQAVDLQIPFANSYKGVSFQCPYCSTVLGASVDFLALQADIINGVAKKLGR